LTPNFGQQLITALHPRAFNAAQLFHATAGRRLLAEAHRIHLAHHLQPQGVVQRQPRLVEQAVGTRPPGWPEEYRRTPASHPHQQRAHRAASAAAIWDTRVPGSSMMQATPPSGMCVSTGRTRKPC
jgi:hypothetical protein